MAIFIWWLHTHIDINATKIKSSALYTESELDFLFLLFVFVAMDKQCAEFNNKFQTQVIFSQIFEIYEEKNIFSEPNTNKIEFLSKNILEIVELEKNKIVNNAEEDPVSSKKLQKLNLQALNNLFHRIIHLIGFFKTSRDKNIRKLSTKLALSSMHHIYNKSNAHTDLDVSCFFFCKKQIKTFS